MQKQKKTGSFHHGNLSEALIKEALALMAERKSTHFSLRELAVNLGVSHAAAYRHFASKTELLLEIALRSFLALRHDLEVEIVKGADGIDVAKSLKQMGAVYVQFAVENEGAYRTLYHPELCNPTLYPQLHQTSLEILLLLILVIQTGQDQLKIENGHNANVLATSVWAGLHGYTSLLIDKQIIETGDTMIASRDTFLDLIYSPLFSANTERVEV